jgi:hypothetical protein
MPTLQELFEELNKRIDKPIDYNHILGEVLSHSFNFQGSQIDGIWYSLDPTRGKYLSVARTILTAGQYGMNQASRYMRLNDIPMMSTGFLMPRDAVLTGIWAKSRSIGGWNIEVRKNDAPITLVSVPIINGSGADLSLNFDLSAGDVLQIYQNGSGIDFPIGALEFAWKTTI